MIEARDITAHLGQRQVLHGVGLRAQAGQVTVIVGPNGSGKTTLLRRLTGDLAGGGQVLQEGADVAHLSPRDLALRRAVLPQSVRVGFPFTLAEIVRLGHEAGHAAHRPGIVAAALDELDLAHKAQGFFHDMSGGEQARGHLARVRAQIWEPRHEGRPCWLFADEPVAALDLGHQLQVMALLRRFADAGGGMVAVLHDLNLTAHYADQVILMDAGQIRAAGPPAAVLTEPLLSAAYRCRIALRTAPADGVWLLPQSARL